MIVAFRRIAHDNSMLDTIDSLFTNSKYVHVQIIFSNGQVGGAWIKTRGVSFRTIKETTVYPDLYAYIKIDENSINEQKTYDFIKSHLGEKFSILGSFYARILPFKQKNVWYCSDIIFSALLAGGLQTKLKYLNKIVISPQKIYNILMKQKQHKLLKFHDSSIQAQYAR